MGVLNVTPDSFSDGGNFAEPSKALRQALKIVEEGASIIDVGGESSRPGAQPVSASEELKRVLPVIQAVRREAVIPISIDTTKAVVAAKALEAGASMINDISSGLNDPEMFAVAARYRVPICLMHMQGTPETMQMYPHYENVMEEIRIFLEQRIIAAVQAGISQENIIIDPGIGFGKSVEDNLTILRRLETFRSLGVPILIGASRKSFIGKITGADVNHRLPGSLAALAAVLKKGVEYIRVHDVAETKQFLDISKAIAG